jgi:hypothetical protein
VSGTASTDIEWISIREFARRDGCDEKLVREAQKVERLPKLSHSKLPASLVGTGWRQRNRRSLVTADGVADAGAESPRIGADRAAAAMSAADVEAVAKRISNEGAPWSLAEAERRKENALAMLRQLEYDTKSGQVVEVAAAAAIHGEQCANIRNKLLGLPSAHAARLARITDVNIMRAALDDLIHHALLDLSGWKEPVAR